LSAILHQALPFDLIFEFLTRPVPMKAEEYARKKTEIGQRASKLLEIGRQMVSEAEYVPVVVCLPACQSFLNP
jgi:hypothetical protein